MVSWMRVNLPALAGMSAPESQGWARLGEGGGAHRQGEGGLCSVTRSQPRLTGPRREKSTITSRTGLTNRHGLGTDTRVRD